MSNISNAYYKNTFLSQNQSIHAASKKNNGVCSYEPVTENIISFTSSHITPFVQKEEDESVSMAK